MAETSIELLVTVVIPAFNAGAYLRPAVASVLGEGSANVEVIVVNDGSTDGSMATIADLPVTIIDTPNRGEAAARNEGIRRSTGDFITFLDADDLLVPNSIGARVAYLRDNHGTRVVGGLPRRLIDPAGTNLGDVFDLMMQKYFVPFSLTWQYYKSGEFFPVSCALYVYRRACFSRLGTFDETLPVAPDCDFHFRVLQAEPVQILPIQVFDRRCHGSNLSLRATGDTYAFHEEIITTLKDIGARYGIATGPVAPWELEYLRLPA